MSKLLLLCSLLVMASCAKPMADHAIRKGQTSTLYLVRHAEKADDGTPDPDLTEDGLSRAARLATILSDKNIEYIFSSDYKRTQQTAAPLADRLGLDVRSYDPGDFSTLITFIDDHPGNVLVVGHSNSTPSLCNALIGEERYASFDESDYGNLIIVTYGTKKSKVTIERF